MPIQTEMVDITVNGDSVSGYLAKPEGNGPFPSVVVIQEWWGLEEHIKDVARRFADEGFVALAPDLYHGDVKTEPSEAQKAMMALDMNRASKELTKAADYLNNMSEVKAVGAIGFCMGGGLALTLACDNANVKAVAPFYGINPQPIEKVANLKGPVLAIYAEHDNFSNEQVRNDLEAALKEHGKDAEIKVYPDTQHAFFNDSRAAMHNAEASKDAWQKALSFFRKNLG